MNRVWHTLKKSSSWMVWKPQMNWKRTLWHNMPQNQTLKNTNRHVITAKSQANIKTHAVNSQKRNTKAKITEILLAKFLSSVKRTLTDTTKRTLILSKVTIQITERTENQQLSTHSVRPVANEPLHREMLNWREGRKHTTSASKTDRTKPKSTAGLTFYCNSNCPRLSPNFKIKIPRLHSGTAFDRAETTRDKSFFSNSRGSMAATLLSYLSVTTS